MATRVKWDDQAAKRIARQAALKAAQDEAERIRMLSMDEAPHATGTMERSSTVSTEGSSVLISYVTPYAIKQHEDLSLRHPDPTNPISSSGRKAKYLEDPFNANKSKTLKYIGLKVKQALRKGGV